MCGLEGMTTCTSEETGGKAGHFTESKEQDQLRPLLCIPNFSNQMQGCFCVRNLLQSRRCLTLRVLKTCIIPSNLSPFRLNSGCRFVTFFISFYFLYIFNVFSVTIFKRCIISACVCTCVCEFIGSTPTQVAVEARRCRTKWSWSYRQL